MAHGGVWPSALAFLGCVAAARGEALVYPVDVAVNAGGDVYIADPGAHALLRLVRGSFQVVARGPGRPRTPLYGIRQIAPDLRGGWVASDPASMGVYRIDTRGGVVPLPDDRYVTPWAVAVEPSGDVLVADRTTQKLRRVARDGTVTDLAVVGAARAVLAGDDGRIMVLTDRSLMRVTGSRVEPFLHDSPFGLALDAVRLPDGGYAVTDGYARTIWRVTPEASVSPLVAAGALESPQGIALAPDGHLLVVDARARTVFRISLSGEVHPLVR